LFLQYTR